MTTPEHPNAISTPTTTLQRMLPFAIAIWVVCGILPGLAFYLGPFHRVDAFLSETWSDGGRGIKQLFYSSIFLMNPILGVCNLITYAVMKGWLR